MSHKISVPMRPFIELGKLELYWQLAFQTFEVTNEIVMAAMTLWEINVDNKWVVKVFVL